MTYNKKFSRGFAGVVCLIAAAAFLSCDKVPDYCGRGERLESNHQFCFDNRTYSLCGGREYNPLTEGCTVNRDVGARCVDGSVVRHGVPCNGYILSAAVAPANSGDITYSSAGPNYPADESVILIAEPRGGYTFAGWAGAEESNKKLVTVTMNKNKPMVAMFVPSGSGGGNQLVTTPFIENSGNAGGGVDNGGTITRVPNKSGYDPGEQVTVTANPDDGYTFTRWMGADTSTLSTIVVTMDGSKPLVAMFTPDAYTLTVNMNLDAGGTVYVNNTASSVSAPAYHSFGTHVEVIAQAAPGYTFTNWSGASESNSPIITVQITGNLTLMANFKHQSGGKADYTYTLTTRMAPDSGGSVTRQPNQQSYGAGTKVRVAANPADGYKFTGWSGGEVEEANSCTTTVTMNSNTILTAGFQLKSDDDSIFTKTHTLTLVADPDIGGTVTGGDTFNDSAYAEITATAYSGYTFSGWTPADAVADSSSASTTVFMIADRTVTANFTKNSGGGVFMSELPGVIGWITNPFSSSHILNAPNNGDKSKITLNSSNKLVIAPLDNPVDPWDLQLLQTEFKNEPCTSGAPAAYQVIIKGSTAGAPVRFSITIQGDSNNGYKDYAVSNDPANGGTEVITVFDDFDRNVNIVNTNRVKDLNAQLCVNLAYPGNGTLTIKSFEIHAAEPTFRLITKAGDGGTVLSGSLEGIRWIPAGQLNQINAKPNDGYTFSGWTPATGVDNPNSATTYISITQNWTVTAIFTKNTVAGGNQFNPDITYGSFTDTRGGISQNYHTVVIDGKTWMAENLNFPTNDSWCYDNADSNCTKYGRLYTWDAAMDACPSGWHLPSRDEWNDAAGGVDAGKNLKSKAGWNENGNGTDEFGFSALPGGYRGTDGSFDSAGDGGFWWSATENGSGYAYLRGMYYNDDYAIEGWNSKDIGFFVRCVRD